MLRLDTTGVLFESKDGRYVMASDVQKLAREALDVFDGLCIDDDYSPVIAELRQIAGEA